MSLEAEQEQIIDFQQASLEFTAAVSEPIMTLSTLPSGWAVSVVFVLLVGLYLWRQGTPVWSRPQFVEQASIVDDGPSLQESGLWICVDEHHANKCLCFLVDRLSPHFQLLVVAPPSQLVPPLLGSIEIISPSQAQKHVKSFAQKLMFNRAQGVVVSTAELPQKLIDHPDVFFVILQPDYPRSWTGAVYGVDFKEDWIWKNQST